MNTGRWLLRLYPRDWRRRYGEEIEELIAAITSEHGRLPLRSRFDLVLAAFYERGEAAMKALRIDRRIALRAAPVAAVVALAVTVGMFASGPSTPRAAQSPQAPTSTVTSQGSTAQAVAAAEAIAAAQAQLQAEQSQMARLQTAAALQALEAAEAQREAQQARASQIQKNHPSR